MTDKLPASRLEFAHVLVARARILAEDLRLDQLPKKFRMTLNDTADMLAELLRHVEAKENKPSPPFSVPPTAEARQKALLEQALDALSDGVESSWPEDQIIDGYRLVCTCGACPEQYDVFDAREQKVGYLRLRHGHFRAEAPGVYGEMVYDADTKGDGIFDADERSEHLQRAVAAINAWCQRAKRQGEDG
jgi:hypothetical protein